MRAVRYLKPHGALYNQAQREPRRRPRSGRGRPTLRFAAARAAGKPSRDRGTRVRACVYVAEGFPDRRYRADGSLAPRSEPGALLHEPHEIEEQVLRLAARRTSRDALHPRRRARRGRERGARPAGLETARDRRPIIRGRSGLMGLVVVNPGLSTTVQDAGRPGYAALGRLRRGRLRPRLGRAGQRAARQFRRLRCSGNDARRRNLSGRRPACVGPGWRSDRRPDCSD